MTRIKSKCTQLNAAQKSRGLGYFLNLNHIIICVSREGKQLYIQPKSLHAQEQT